MNTRQRQSQRGQAVVETVLGLLVFISLLVFAIFLSETVYASMKVQEASVSALWDSTAGHMHDWPTLFGGTGAAGGTVSNAASLATARYQDLDGRTNVNGSLPHTEVFAQTSNLSVSCGMGGGPKFPGGGLAGGVLDIMLLGTYADNGGVTCGASADVTAFKFPNSFLDSGSNATFRVQNFQNTPLKACGVGRPLGGSCQGTYKMMIDDWGLAGGQESGVCIMIPDVLISLPVAVPCVPNLRYWTMTLTMYMKSTFLTALMAASQLRSSVLASTVVNQPSPINEDLFWMSFEGETPTFFMHPLFPQDALPFIVYPTNPGGASILMPFYAISYGKRTRCFLGQPCN